MMGGDDKEEEKFIAPTVIRDVKLTDPVMQDEVIKFYFTVARLFANLFENYIFCNLSLTNLWFVLAMQHILQSYQKH